MNRLLVIDAQNDFCDLPDDACPRDAAGALVKPALPVPGAHADMLRLAAFIDAAADAIGDITLTLDSHHRIDIAHPPFWQHADGSPVAPFTPIDAAAVRAGTFLPRVPEAFDRALHYVDELERRGRYTLMVWPVHCEIGSWGHAVHAAVRAAYNRWEERTLHAVHKVMKGSNPWTEHYSAVIAEVPDAGDPGTQLNRRLVEHVAAATRLVIAGEAGSHCVRATTEDLVQHVGGDLGRIALLTDCMSPVTGFETAQREFLAAMRARGVRLLTCSEAARWLRG